MDYLFLVGRILFGGYFLINGINHFTKTNSLEGYAESSGLKNARLWVLLTGMLLVLGGLGVMFGAFTDLALLFLLVFLVGVTPKIHAYWKIQDPQKKMSQQMDFMRNVALLGAVLMMFVIADWPLSIM